MTDEVRVVAATNVAFGGRIYRSGSRFGLPAPCAHALAASGNVRIEAPAEPAEPPIPQETLQKDEDRPPVQTSARGGPASDPIPLEKVSGIGPSTAARLRAAGVADVAALAALTDDRARELRIRDSWREQARALTPAA